jgi:hypothetical protein
VLRALEDLTDRDRGETREPRAEQTERVLGAAARAVAREATPIVDELRERDGDARHGLGAMAVWLRRAEIETRRAERLRERELPVARLVGLVQPHVARARVAPQPRVAHAPARDHQVLTRLRLHRSEPVRATLPTRRERRPGLAHVDLVAKRETRERIEPDRCGALPALCRRKRRLRGQVRDEPTQLLHPELHLHVEEGHDAGSVATTRVTDQRDEGAEQLQTRLRIELRERRLLRGERLDQLVDVLRTAPPARRNLQETTQERVPGERVAEHERVVAGDPEQMLRELPSARLRLFDRVVDVVVRREPRQHVRGIGAQLDRLVGERRRKRLFERETVFADDGIGPDRVTEELTREARERVRAVRASHRRRRPDPAEAPRREIRACFQSTHQARHVGRLRAVVDVNLVEHEVAERAGMARREEPGVLRVQKEQIEHPIVRQQHVRRVLPQCAPPLLRLRTHVEPDAHLVFQSRIRRDHSLRSLDLIGRERVHRIDDDRLDAGPLSRVLPKAVIEDRIEETLRLPGARTRRHQRRARRLVARREPLPRRDLVRVGREVGRQVQRRRRVRARPPKRQPQIDERPTKEPLLRVLQEREEPPLEPLALQPERGAQVVDESSTRLEREIEGLHRERRR